MNKLVFSNYSHTYHTYNMFPPASLAKISSQEWDSKGFDPAVWKAKGKRFTDLTTQLYGNVPIPMWAHFNMLNRDTTPKLGEFGKSDPFIKEEAFLVHESGLFNICKDVKDMYHDLVQRALGAGWIENLSGGVQDPYKFTVTSDLDSASVDKRIFLSEVDILTKFSIVRAVSLGWNLTDYRGNDIKPKGKFKDAIDEGCDILAYVISQKMKMMHIQQRVKGYVTNEQGDPLDSNSGSPLFDARVSEDGLSSSSKLETVELYNRFLDDVKDAVLQLKQFTRALGYANGISNPAFKNTAFVFGLGRRSQAGVKYNPLYELFTLGLSLIHIIRGLPSTRVIWMAPYVLNLLLSPFESMLKIIKESIVGLSYDDEDMAFLLKLIETKYYISIEYDYSNYDRFILVYLIEQLLMKLKFYCKDNAHIRDFLEVYTYAYKNITVLATDPKLGARFSGMLYKILIAGLLSGIKLTNLIGSFGNVVKNIAVSLLSKTMNRNLWISFLMADVKEQKTPQVPVLNLISSDDLLNCFEPGYDKNYTEQFKSLCSHIGLPIKTNTGSKFLMKHMIGGMYTPIYSRILQNTISPEKEGISAAKFMLGFVSRTDGVLGMHTHFPGKKTIYYRTPYVTEVEFWRRIAPILNKYLSIDRLWVKFEAQCQAALKKNSSSLQMYLDLFDVFKDYIRILFSCKHSSELTAEVHIMRLKLITGCGALLSASEAKQLVKDLRFTPGKDYLLQHGLGDYISHETTVENNFYHNMMDKLHINPLII